MNLKLLLFLITILQTTSISAQYGLYTSGPIWFQFGPNYDLGKQIELHNLDASYGWDSAGSTNAQCDQGNGTNTGLILFKDNVEIHDFGIACSGTNGSINWSILGTLIPGDDYFFYFYYDHRPTSSCCAAFYSITTATFTIGSGPTVITPQNGGIYLSDLTFEWTESIFDDNYRLEIFNDPNYSQSCINGTTSGTAALFVDDLLVPSYQVPEGTLNLGTTYNYIVTAKQFGLCFRAFGSFTTDTNTPVELIDFQAKEENSSVSLKWSTASEFNNDYFTVEHSSDGRYFKNIGEIQGNGNSSLVSEYSFNHDQPVNGLNYYRLAQFDFDGTTTTSPIESLRFSSSKISIYPTTVERFIQVSGIEDEKLIQFSVYDFTGKLILKSKQDNSNNSIDLIKLKKGQYLFSVVTSNGIVTNYFRKI